MPDLKLSELNEITSLSTGDLIAVSEDQGGGSYISKKIDVSNLDFVKGIRHYGTSTIDPTSPTPQAGDCYYNTVLDMEMRYDGDRSKWLSVESQMMYFGRNGTVGDGVYYRTTNGLAYSATNGFYTAWNGCVVGLGYTRNDTDAATFEVTNDGSSLVTLASGAIAGASTTLNANFSSGEVLGVRNQSGSNITTNVHGWVKIRWRI
jgi:hypothetical protein